jgi:RimJ/RimL family protein N-acetyltransferase
VDTAVAIDFPAAIRWAELLGFEREGVMRKYAEGKDFYLYSQVV